MLLGASVGLALVAGIVEGLVSQWLSLLLVFPLLIGVAAGGGAHWAIRSRKIRAPLAAMGIAALAGFLGETAVHYLGYRAARATVAERVEGLTGTIDFVALNGVDAAVDSVFAGHGVDQVPPFVGYLRAAAERGITITSAHGSSSGGSPTLTGVGVYSLWVLEYLLAIGVAVLMAREQASAPFCEGCNGWYTRIEKLAVGDGHKSKFKPLKSRLETGQFADAVRELGKSDGKTAAVVLLKGCTTCNAHEPVLELHSLTALNTKKPQEHVVYRSLVTPTQAQALRTATAPPPQG